MTHLQTDLNLYLKTKGQLIAEHLDKLVPEKKVSHHQLFRAARYTLLSGGKRVRPILALATCESLNGSIEEGLDAACALEMVHSYSMIHDDLPCMDNDDFRRGIPTLHQAFPEGHALLAGDYLLTRAFEVIAQCNALTNEKKIKLIALLAQSSGGEGMIAGQIMDIEAETKPIDIESLQLIHQCKTGALIAASIEFGAIIADADQACVETLRSFGKKVGLAFQIMDDILDVTTSIDKHGKSISSDILNGKKTYPSLVGLEKARETTFSLLNEAIQQLEQLPFDPLLLSDLAKFIVTKTI